jgi:hypothetical protein
VFWVPKVHIGETISLQDCLCFPSRGCRSDSGAAEHREERFSRIAMTSRLSQDRLSTMRVAILAHVAEDNRGGGLHSVRDGGLSMDNADVFARFASTFAAKQVHSEPCKVDGITVITAAVVGGGAGMRQAGNEPEARHGGMGGSARPVGAFIIRDGVVTWKPALDLQRVTITVGLLVGALTVGWLIARRSRRD